MARERAWWNQRRFDQTTDATFTRDLLFGSGLAVAGATVLRLIGRLEWHWQQASSSSAPQLLFGIYVTDAPDTDDLSADTGIDWLFYTEVLPGASGSVEGDRVGTTVDSETTSWDVDGRRVLAAGESVHLAARQFNRDVTGRVDRLTLSRVLMLTPDT